uniref:F-box/LRR-repeat protein n=1 Tax=Steinernema glaseri TaxID=37863 RepID=A0A1I8A043_9BILA
MDHTSDLTHHIRRIHVILSCSCKAMDGVPVLFIVEVCRQLTTQHASAINNLEVWGNVATDLFRDYRNVRCLLFCKRETSDVRVILCENSKHLSLEELKSSPNLQLSFVGVWIDNGAIVEDVFTRSYAAQLSKLCSNLCFSIKLQFRSWDVPNSLLNFPVLYDFLMSLPRIHLIDFDSWSLAETLIEKVAARGTLRKILLCSLSVDSTDYKEVLRKFCKYENLQVFRYYHIINKNIEMSDEEKAHFRMEKNLKTFAVDFFRI